MCMMLTKSVRRFESRRINTVFNRKPRNLDGKTPVHIQGVATIEEIDELRKITGTTSNQAMVRALINEKLYPQAKAEA